METDTLISATASGVETRYLVDQEQERRVYGCLCLQRHYGRIGQRLPAVQVGDPSNCVEAA